MGTQAQQVADQYPTLGNAYNSWTMEPPKGEQQEFLAEAANEILSACGEITVLRTALVMEQLANDHLEDCTHVAHGGKDVEYCDEFEQLGQYAIALRHIALDVKCGNQEKCDALSIAAIVYVDSVEYTTSRGA